MSFQNLFHNCLENEILNIFSFAFFFLLRLANRESIFSKNSTIDVDAGQGHRRRRVKKKRRIEYENDALDVSLPGIRATRCH